MTTFFSFCFIYFVHLLSFSFRSEISPQVGHQETSISGSQISESGTSEIDSKNGVQAVVPAITFAEAQRLISLFFALCTKVHLQCVYMAENTNIFNLYFFFLIMLIYNLFHSRNLVFFNLFLIITSKHRNL